MTRRLCADRRGGPVKMVRLVGYGASPRTLVKVAILTPH